MPILPLDHPEPFAATLGVMLYPGIDNDDPAKARAFTSHYLATKIERYEKAGHKTPRDVLLGLVIDGGQRLDDLDERWWGGRATGELFKNYGRCSTPTRPLQPGTTPPKLQKK